MILKMLKQNQNKLQQLLIQAKVSNKIPKNQKNSKKFKKIIDFLNFLRIFLFFFIVPIVDVLSRFVAYKTVSSDPLLKSECWKGAKYLYSLLDNLGVETKLVQGK